MPTRHRRAAAGRADLARAARPVRRLGLDLPRHRDRGRDDPAVPDGGRPVLCSPGLILLAWSIAREGRAFVVPTPARMARQRDRRRAAARRRDGHGRVRRADRPVRDHRPADRDDAGLGRDPRSDLPRRAAAAAGGRRHRRRVRRRRDPRRPVGVRRGRARSTRSAWRRSSSRPIAWASGSLFASHRAVLPQPAARRDGHPDGPRRPRPGR